jgi:predicted RNase H-like nuclease (RuvC/YqgF family)
MGVYTENIFNLSLNDLVRNIKSLEMKVADDEKKIKRYEKRDEDPQKIEDLLETQRIWLRKLHTNLRALDEKCDAAAEEIEQLKREGKWFCEEE